MFQTVFRAREKHDECCQQGRVLLLHLAMNARTRKMLQSTVLLKTTMSTELTKTQLQQILKFATSLAREAGALILTGSTALHANSAATSDEKKNSVDLVTEYDVAVEKLVQEKLKAEYPSFGFIGEESYSAGIRPEITDVPTFCVDPIDGTTNFVHGFPFVCHSLGLIYKQRPVIGVIYNPFLDHMVSLPRD